VCEIKTCSHALMRFKLSEFILFLGLLMMLAPPVYAAENSTEELTLEGELTPIPQPPPNDAIDEFNVDIEGQEVRSIEQEYALDGFSVGALLFNHNYNVYANLLVNNASVDVSRKSSDFQSAGVIGRYAAMPYDKIGTDVSLSVATTLNHASLNYSSILTVRGEVNLAYTFDTGSDTPIYMLGGLGYALTKGKDIEDILSAGGAAFQVGGGIALNKKLNFEFIYSYVKHSIADKYLQSLAASAIANGATSATYNANEASVISNVLLGRITFNY